MPLEGGATVAEGGTFGPGEYGQSYLTRTTPPTVEEDFMEKATKKLLERGAKMGLESLLKPKPYEYAEGAARIYQGERDRSNLFDMGNLKRSLRRGHRCAHARRRCASSASRSGARGSRASVEPEQTRRGREHDGEVLRGRRRGEQGSAGEVQAGLDRGATPRHPAAGGGLRLRRGAGGADLRGHRARAARQSAARRKRKKAAATCSPRPRRPARTTSIAGRCVRRLSDGTIFEREAASPDAVLGRAVADAEPAAREPRRAALSRSPRPSAGARGSPSRRPAASATSTP